MNQKLTKEKALKLHREMWSDMQKELGDMPNPTQRITFKDEWLRGHGYVDEVGETNIYNDCFLCEYAVEQYSGFGKPLCYFCPIDWSSLTPNKDGMHYGTCRYKPNNDSYLAIWQTEDINKILLLPEKN